MSTETNTASIATSVLSNADNILTALIPALGKYGPAISLGISVLEKVAPPVYNEIVTLIHQIQSGNTVSDEDIAKLAGLVDSLKNPDKYFATPPVAPVVTTTTTTTETVG